MSKIDESGMLIQKVRGGALFNTFTKWGIVVTNSVAPLDGGECKENGFQEFADINGNDIVDLDSKFIKAFDIEIPFACIGSSPSECRAKKNGFVEYLCNNGIQHKIYIHWIEQGRNNVEYKGESNQKFKRDINGESVYTFSLKFTINDPISEIVADADNLNIVTP